MVFPFWQWNSYAPHWWLFQSFLVIRHYQQPWQMISSLRLPTLFLLFIFTVCSVWGAGSMKLLSVRPSVRPSHRSAAACCCCSGFAAVSLAAGDIDQLPHGWHSAANPSSVTLSAGIGRWTQTGLDINNVIFLALGCFGHFWQSYSYSDWWVWVPVWGFPLVRCGNCGC